MGRSTDGSGSDPKVRVERALRRCAELNREGHHREVVATTDAELRELGEDSHLRAALLVWNAQALLSLGQAQRALTSASLSWELEPTPHACHLTANALEALGGVDEAEELLRMGWRLFPDAVHLAVQLAIIFSDQARIPEALDILQELPLDDRVPDDLEIFLFGMRSNLLAALGRWAEADDLLGEGIAAHPDSALLNTARADLQAARRRSKAESALASSWASGLEKLETSAAEVDESIVRCGQVHELPELVVLAARRLWRAFLERHRARPQAPDVWAAGLILAVLELDGEAPPAATFARSFACRPSSVRSVIARLRRFTDSLDREFAMRGFAARNNPRLEGMPHLKQPPFRSAEVVRFPTP